MDNASNKWDRGSAKQVAWANKIVAALDVASLTKDTYSKIVSMRHMMDTAKLHAWVAGNGKIGSSTIEPIVRDLISSLHDAVHVIDFRGDALECEIAEAAAANLVAQINA